MSLEALMALVPPPTEPFEAFEGPWEPVEAALGTALPQDYKDFVRVYGSGYFMQILGVHVPGSANLNTQLEHQVRVWAETFREFGDAPYPVWPEPGGLMAFGGTDNGDVLSWLQRGMPDEWVVVVWDRGLQEFEILECSLTDFLAGMASGERLPEAFPDDFTPEDRTFEAHTPLT